MAITFMDSFDGYPVSTSPLTSMLQGKYTFQVNDVGRIKILSSSGRWGSNCLQFNNISDPAAYLWRDITQAATISMGAGFRIDDAGSSSNALMSAEDSGTRQVGLYYTTAMRLGAYAGGVDRGLFGPTLAISTWNHIEFSATIHNTTGSLKVRINGITVLDLTNIDTQATSNAWVNRFRVGEYWDRSYAIYSLDDLYVTNDTNLLGDTRVQYLVPTGAGARTQFSPSAGSNWQTVDETSTSDADYNSSNVPGAMDLFTITDLAGNGLVYGVQTISRARKDDAGFRKAAPVFYKASGLGDTARWYRGSQSPVIDDFTLVAPQVFAVSPDTGVAWTVDEINALQYGYAVGDAGMFTLDAKVV